jgi:gamma-glutamyltranspeptidase/glutathione hydrolase
VLPLMVEAFKHAFADRARWLGDPGDAPGHARRLLAPEYLDELSARLRVQRTGEAWMYGHGWRRGEGGMGVVEDGGTSHLSVVDARGNAVACTETINLEFGSLLAVPRYGFVLNNQMDDFTSRAGAANAFGLRQSELNRPGPGRRPLSSMSPTIVLDALGRVEVVAGASGGPRIITGTGQVLLNVLVHGMGAEAGVAAPRVHHQWMPDVLRVDVRLSAERARLEAAGHRLEPLTSESAVQVVVRSRDGQVWEAAADPRKGGGTAGH